MTPEHFLVDHEARFPWQLSDAPAALQLEPLDGFTGRGAHPLEVALATAVGRPRADDVRRVWRARHGRAPNPLLLVVAFEQDGAWRAGVCGPVGDDPPVEIGLALGEVERIAQAALDEPTRQAAIRFLGSIWAELETELPGLRNQGMFAAHELREGVPRLANWSDACGRGREVLPYWGAGLSNDSASVLRLMLLPRRF